MRKALDPTAQRDLFGAGATPPDPEPSRGAPPATSSFSGSTIDPTLDEVRLSEQLGAVVAIMRDGEWRTLAELAELVSAPEASVSARLRDLRKPRFGAWTVERRRVPEGNGLHQYRAVKPTT
ncbi:MAG: hypothetical protein EPN91_12340 [Salinibacterium sp.]|nr:MAG: hypothetical protein EPN91_12340 [Salinibacterium sp.]